MTRAKTKTRWRTIKKLGKGDELVELEFCDATRRANPEIPEHWVVRAIRYQRPGFKPSTLLTSLTDHHYFSARELTALYHERWELEQRAFDFGAAQTLHQILDLGGESAPSRALGAGLLPARRQAQPGPIV